MNQPSEESVKTAIRSLGLTDGESKVYIFLAKRGPLRGGETARNLKMYKAQVYHILKNLQRKGWVQSTLEFPTRFTAVPFAEIIDSHVKLKREEAQLIESTKENLLSHWSSLDRDRNELSPERFVVIEGRNKMFVKIFQMIEETTRELKMLLTGYPLAEIVSEGAFPVTFDKLKKSQIRIKALTQVSGDNLNILEKTLAKLSRQGLEGRVEIRHLANSSFFSRMQIRDRQEAILHLTPPPDSASLQDEKETALWTNSKAVVEVFDAFFEKLWSDSIDADEVLKETGSQ